MRKKPFTVVQKQIILKRAFDIWVRGYKDYGYYANLFNRNGIVVTSKVEDILGLTSGRISACAESLVLATVSVKQLGLPDGVQLRQILYAGVGAPVVWKDKEYYLSPVRAVDVLEFRLIYEDQPRNEWLRAAMEGIRHQMGNNVILRVVCGPDGVLYLDVDDGGDLDDRFDDHANFIWKLCPTTHHGKGYSNRKDYRRKVVVPRDLEHPHDW